MKFLLDSATFWWLATDSDRLSARALEVFADADNEIALSPVSTWELLVKHQAGKLPTTKPITELLLSAKDERFIHTLPLVDSAVLRLATLPPLHRDPFDRILVCQAIDSGMTLLTPDSQIRAYPVSSMW